MKKQHKCIINGVEYVVTNLILTQPALAFVTRAIGTKIVIWDNNLNQDFPSICPRCGAPAYIGLNRVDCSENCDGTKDEI